MATNFNSVVENLLFECLVKNDKATNPFISFYNLSKKKSSLLSDLREKIDDLLLISEFNSLIKNNEIQAMINSNPKVLEILVQCGIKKEINLSNVFDIYNIHCLHVLKIAKSVCKELNLSVKDTKIVKKSALFHDFGKVLIPSSILNKPSGLTFYEKEIVDLHAQLGYELLKTLNFEKQVLDIVKNHHNLNKKNNAFDLLNQIVSVSDIYSALVSERSYKKAYSDKKAFEILYEMCESGKLNKKVVIALKNSLS